MKVGIDIIEISRLEDICNNTNKLKRLFTQKEIAYFDKFSEKLSHIAGFFCVKEAFVKALGTGFCGDVFPLDFEVLHDENGKPYLNFLSQKLKDLTKNKKMDISISHSKTVSTAICIMSED